MKFVERKIIFHGSHFVDFYFEQTTKVQEKIEFVFHIIKRVERVSKSFSVRWKTLTDFLKSESNTVLISIEFSAALMKGESLFCSTHFKKKTQKTPQKEIEKALKLKREYFELKKTQENGKRSN